MSNVAIGLVIVWFVGLLFLFGYGLNLGRLVLNNLIPGRDYWNASDYFRLRTKMFSMGVRPSDLTELGRQYHKRAIWIDRITWAWMIGGFVLVVGACSYWKSS